MANVTMHSVNFQNQGTSNNNTRQAKTLLRPEFCPASNFYVEGLVPSLSKQDYMETGSLKRWGYWGKALTHYDQYPYKKEKIKIQMYTEGEYHVNMKTATDKPERERTQKKPTLMTDPGILASRTGRI